LKAEPRVSVQEGGGRIVGTETADWAAPGAHATVLRLGPDPGSQVFLIEAGEIRKTVTFTAE
jgi:hypothetical protein